nr:MAG TPA: hypothetical protein [Caudoviricetes sp.]
MNSGKEHSGVSACDKSHDIRLLMNIENKE